MIPGVPQALIPTRRESGQQRKPYTLLLDKSNTASSNCRVEFKLEQERARSDCFDHSLRSIDCINEGGTSLKFPLLVMGPDGKPARVLLVAESTALDPFSISLQRLRTEISLEDVVSHFANTPAKEHIHPSPYRVQGSIVQLLFTASPIPIFNHRALHSPLTT